MIVMVDVLRVVLVDVEVVLQHVQGVMVTVKLVVLQDVLLLVGQVNIGTKDI
jgi:hypothetical protein